MKQDGDTNSFGTFFEEAIVGTRPTPISPVEIAKATGKPPGKLWISIAMTNSDIYLIRFFRAFVSFFSEMLVRHELVEQPEVKPAITRILN